MNRRTITPCLFTLTVCLTVAGLNAAALAQGGGGRLTGKVLDARERTPVAHATVTLAELGKTAEVGAAGDFSLEEVPAGTYSLEVSAFGYKSLRQRVRVSEQPTKPFEFLMLVEPVLKEEVIVTASGQPEPVKDLSQSTGVVTAGEVAVTKAVGLDEVLNEIPGVKAESQAETQEVRLSIRGRGLNTSFGTRSIRVLVDGIPESDSTGETSDLTGIDLDSVERLEVVKGPMAAQYGASSSGVVNVITEKGSQVPFVEAKTVFGSYGFWKSQAKLSGNYKPLDYLFDFTRTAQDGYREHEKLRAYHVNGRLGVALDEKTNLNFFFRGADTDSQLPGNLSADELQADRRQAGFLFKLFDAQSNIAREQFGVSFNRQWGDDRSLWAMFYGRHIDFQVPVPFVFLNGRRNSFGGDVRYSFRQAVGKTRNALTFGANLQHDHEVRKDFDNDAGQMGAGVQRDETRRLYNTGVYFLDNIGVGEKLDFRVGLNYTRVHVRIDDFLFADGDDSGARLFDKFSYQLGATYHLTPEFSLYGNVSTGFDPPTITEIGRNPEGKGGLNPDLRPERSMNYEVGGLYNLPRKTYVNFSVFRLRVNDEIVPTGIGFPQETFINAARAVHNGVELGGGANLYKDLSLRVGYTYSDFYYRTFVNGFGDFSGKRIPGIPAHRFFAGLRYQHRSGVYSGFDLHAVGKIFADDGNNVTNDSYQVGNWYGGYERYFKRFSLRLLYRVNNLFNQQYSSYIVVNDRFGGYFYPSPTRNQLGSVAFAWYF
ncbi:MAG: TonB-dependent receptor [Acidobacteria bacterium]|nr:TonB-dependent receptor [Acidobacteriota bacterium]